MMKMKLVWVGCLMIAGCATTDERAAQDALNSKANALGSGNHHAEKSTLDSRDKPLDGTLEQYLARAIENSPELQASFARWRAQVHRVSTKRRLPDPVISYSYYVSAVETRTGPQRHKLGLRQTLVWPSVLSSGADSAAAAAGSLEKKFDAKVLLVRARVAEAYYRIWELEQIISLHRDHQELLETLSLSVAGRVSANGGFLFDLQKVDLRAARLSDTIDSLVEKKRSTEAMLRSFIGEREDFPVTVSSEPSDGPMQIKPDDRLIADAMAHPDLAAIEQMAYSKEQEGAVARGSSWPMLTLGIDWIQTDEREDVQDMPENGKDALMVGVSLGVPIFASADREMEVAANAEAAAFRADRRAAELSIAAQVVDAASRVRDAGRRIRVLENTLVPQSTGLLVSVQGGYTAGLVDVNAVLGAEEELLELLIQLISARADQAVEFARLESYTATNALASDNENKGKGQK